MRCLARWMVFFSLVAVAYTLGFAPSAFADGAVYAMTNAIGNNQIVVYHRAADGTLTLMQTIATGGGGGGAQLAPPVDSLGSQGGLVLDAEHHLLFAVNTESLAANTQDCQRGTITSFLVADNGTLSFADRVPSGGLYPDSLTVRSSDNDNEDDQGSALLYVLNAGGPGASPFCGAYPNITGFRVSDDGGMSLLPGSVQSIIDPGLLNGTGFGENCRVGGFPTPAFNCGRNPPAFPRSPAEVRFTPDGTRLIVTVKGTNSIYVFPVGEHGSPTITVAPGPALPTDFGIDFDSRGHMLITEAFGVATSIPMGGAGALSSYTINPSGTLSQISTSIGDLGTAACWIAVEPITGLYAYVGNNLSNSISSYSIANDGSVTLLAAVAAGVPQGISGPNDMARATDGGSSFLYVLNSGAGTVGAFRVNLGDGSLTALPSAGGLPINQSAQGLAAY